MIGPRRMRCVEHVASMNEKRNAGFWLESQNQKDQYEDLDVRY
jgi:hypothetical protein